MRHRTFVQSKLATKVNAKPYSSEAHGRDCTYKTLHSTNVDDHGCLRVILPCTVREFLRRSENLRVLVPAKNHKPALIWSKIRSGTIMGHGELDIRILVSEGMLSSRTS